MHRNIYIIRILRFLRIVNAQPAKCHKVKIKSLEECQKGLKVLNGKSHNQTGPSICIENEYNQSHTKFGPFDS